MPIILWGLGNLIGDMGKIIQNVEHSNPPFIGEEIVDDVDIIF